MLSSLLWDFLANPLLSCTLLICELSVLPIRSLMDLVQNLINSDGNTDLDSEITTIIDVFKKYGVIGLIIIFLFPIFIMLSLVIFGAYIATHFMISVIYYLLLVPIDLVFIFLLSIIRGNPFDVDTHSFTKPFSVEPLRRILEQN